MFRTYKITILLLVLIYICKINGIFCYYKEYYRDKFQEELQNQY